MKAFVCRVGFQSLLRCGWLVAVLGLSGVAWAGEAGLPLFDAVDKAFPGVAGEALSLNAGLSGVLRGGGVAEVRVALPVGGGEMDVFALESFSVLTPASAVVAFDGKSERPVATDVRFFRGASTTHPERRGYIAVLNASEAMGMIWGPGQETQFIAPVANEKGSGLHTVGPEPVFDMDPASFCGVVDSGAFSPAGEGGVGKAGETLLVQMMVDVAYRVYQNTFGSNATEASSVVLGMVGAVSAVYLSAVNVRVVTSRLVVWDGPDSFTGSTSSNQLDVYGAYCEANRTSVVRDVGFLLDGASDVNGVAWLSSLCTTFGYGVVNLPVFNPTVRIITLAHELGHSFGSPHTHCYSPPIDCCYAADSCSTCGSAVAQVGTIMSYCHTISGGDRILEFHSRVKSVLRSGAESASSCVSISPPLVGPPSLVSPPDGGSVAGNSVSLVWNSVAGAAGYQAQIANNPGFSGATTSGVLTATSFNVSSLPNDGTVFYWRVQAGNAAGWSGWSGPRSFTNGSTVTIPAAPVLTSPADGANVPGASVPLVWSASAGATVYEVQHSLFASFASPWTSPQTSATTINWNSLPSTGGTYYWRVRAGNSAGWSDWSAGRHFVNGSSVPLPAVPGRVKPDEGSVILGTFAVLEWSAVSGATKYENQIAYNSAFNPVWGQTPADWTQSHVQWSPMPNNGTTLYWRVRAGNEAGWSAWSPTWSFVSGEALAVPGRVKPAEGEVVSGANAVLEWTAVSGATKYENQIAFNSAFNPVWGQTPANWTQSHVQWGPMPNNGTTLYWRTRAGNDAGWSAWSPTWSFVSGSAAACYSLSVSNGLAQTSQNCAGGYSSGTVVTIAANTAPGGQVFDKWTGDGVANALSSTTTITMNGNKSVTATYKSNSTVQSVSLNRTVTYGNCWERDGYVTVPGVSRIRLVLQVGLEYDIDYLYAGSQAYTGTGPYTTSFYNGDTVNLELESDSSITGSIQIVRAEYEGTRTSGSPVFGGSLFNGGSGDDCIDPCTPSTGCGGTTCVKLYESRQVAYPAKSDGRDVSLETEREIAGVEGPLSISGKVWRIQPEAAFDAPVTVQVPLPDGMAGEDAQVLYLVIEPEVLLWYLGQNIRGWLAEAPREVLGEDGTRYLELVVTHGGRLQIVERSVLGQEASVVPLTEWILTVAALVGVLAGLERGWRRLRR